MSILNMLLVEEVIYVSVVYNRPGDALSVVGKDLDNYVEKVWHLSHKRSVINHVVLQGNGNVTNNKIHRTMSHL